jgi:AraC-like DNA-binding protein
MPTSGDRDAFLAALVDPRKGRLRTAMPQSLVIRARPYASPWRCIDEHHLIFTLRDELVVRHPGGTVRLAAGDAAWLPARLPHSLENAKPRTQYRLRFRLDSAAGLLRLEGGPFLRRNAWRLMPLFELAHREWNDGDDGDRMRLRCLLALLLSYLAEKDATAKAQQQGCLSATQRMAVEQRFAGWATMGIPDPAELARAAGLGADWFGRAFTRTYGMPPRLWLARQRLDLAAGLLVSTTEAVDRISRRLGFAQAAQFNRRFRQVFGASPAKWREDRLT